MFGLYSSEGLSSSRKYRSVYGIGEILAYRGISSTELFDRGS